LDCASQAALFKGKMGRINNIRIRRGTEQDWSRSNPVLDSGELGLDTTNNLLKIGNGADVWTGLSPLACNPISLVNGSDVTNDVAVRSSLIDFKIAQEHNIFIVPNGFCFFIDSTEIITSSIISPSEAPHLRFGNSNENEAYLPQTQTTSNSSSARHIIQNPQNAIPSGTTVSLGIVVASTASHHNGYVVIRGYLMRLDDQPSESSSTSVYPSLLNKIQQVFWENK